MHWKPQKAGIKAGTKLRGWQAMHCPRGRQSPDMRVMSWPAPAALSLCGGPQAAVRAGRIGHSAWAALQQAPWWALLS